MSDSASGTLVGAQLSDRLRARGWRITPQRRAILGALSGEQVHLSAEQVHAAARRTVPEVSLATVYNTLNELVRLAEVSEIHLADGSARYDPKVGPEHHHLVCEGCGLMFDVEPIGVAGLSLPLAQRFGMTVDSVEVVFRGRCSRCAEQSGTGVGEPDRPGVGPR
jgi:Fur family transcriptional regulator, stress-responsive regulator